MCYNEPVSWVTFGIGTFFTIINLIKFHSNINLVFFNIFWYFAITMQFWEANIYKFKDDPKLCNIYTKGAFYNNIFQPFVFLLVIIIDFMRNKKFKIEHIIAIMILIFYTYGLYTQDTFKSVNEDYCAYNPDGLVYNWWRNYSGVFYFFTVIMLFLILFKSSYLFQLFLYVGSFVLTHLIRKGDSGSLWCWIASYIPVINYIYFSMITK